MPKSVIVIKLASCEQEFKETNYREKRKPLLKKTDYKGATS